MREADIDLGGVEVAVALGLTVRAMEAVDAGDVEVVDKPEEEGVTEGDAPVDTVAEAEGVPVGSITVSHVPLGHSVQ